MLISLLLFYYKDIIINHTSTEHVQLPETSVSPEKLGEILRSSADAWLAHGKQAFKGDKKMIAAYRDDRKQLLKVVKELDKGNFKNAAALSRSLDTIIREQIPDSVWDYLKHYQG